MLQATRRLYENMCETKSKIAKLELEQTVAQAQIDQLSEVWNSYNSFFLNYISDNKTAKRAKWIASEHHQPQRQLHRPVQTAQIAHCRAHRGFDGTRGQVRHDPLDGRWVELLARCGDLQNWADTKWLVKNLVLNSENKFTIFRNFSNLVGQENLRISL